MRMSRSDQSAMDVVYGMIGAALKHVSERRDVAQYHEDVEQLAVWDSLHHGLQSLLNDIPEEDGDEIFIAIEDIDKMSLQELGELVLTYGIEVRRGCSTSTTLRRVIKRWLEREA